MTNRAGRVESIHLANGEGEATWPADRVLAVAGVGLEGDRYASGRGHFSKMPGTGRALTLIEAEVLEATSLLPAEARRNLVTRGIALNELVGRRFTVGGVLCEGKRLCEPCTYLEELTRRPLLEPLLHRGGLRADVLEGGEIRVGDAVRPLAG